MFYIKIFKMIMINYIFKKDIFKKKTKQINKKKNNILY